MKQPPYRRCSPAASLQEIAENWNRSHRPAPAWENLTADERKLIIHNTRFPGASGGTPTSVNIRRRKGGAE